MLKAAKAYMATQVTTASQGDLLLMLYDTAIKHLRQAIEKMQAKDVAAKGIFITKALNIISELQECLNKDRGGDISKNLFALYFYCNTRLLKANMQMKPELVEEVISILFGLRQAFAQIMPTTDGVASIVQQSVGGESAAPSADPAAGQGAAPAAPVASPATEDASAAPEAEGPAQNAQQPAAPAAPVNSLRLRAANAYATTR